MKDKETDLLEEREDGDRSLSHQLAPSLVDIKCLVHGDLLVVTWAALSPTANGYMLIIVARQLYV